MPPTRPMVIIRLPANHAKRRERNINRFDPQISQMSTDEDKSVFNAVDRKLSGHLVELVTYLRPSATSADENLFFFACFAGSV
jgi:hypothetical protein